MRSRLIAIWRRWREPKPLDRPVAIRRVAKYVVTVGPCQGVHLKHVGKLLGGKRTWRLLNDAVRNFGPGEPGTYIYPWNVADYLQFPTLNEGKPFRYPNADQVFADQKHRRDMMLRVIAAAEAAVRLQRELLAEC